MAFTYTGCCIPIGYMVWGLGSAAVTVNMLWCCGQAIIANVLQTHHGQSSVTISSSLLILDGTILVFILLFICAMYMWILCGYYVVLRCIKLYSMCTLLYSITLYYTLLYPAILYYTIKGLPSNRKNLPSQSSWQLTYRTCTHPTLNPRFPLAVSNNAVLGRLRSLSMDYRCRSENIQSGTGTPLLDRRNAFCKAGGVSEEQPINASVEVVQSESARRGKAGLVQ